MSGKGRGCVSHGSFQSQSAIQFRPNPSHRLRANTHLTRTFAQELRGFAANYNTIRNLLWE